MPTTFYRKGAITATLDNDTINAGGSSLPAILEATRADQSLYFVEGSRSFEIHLGDGFSTIARRQLSTPKADISQLINDFNLHDIAKALSSVYEGDGFDSFKTTYGGNGRKFIADLPQEDTIPPLKPGTIVY